jgi:hypothetical protein
MVAKAKEKHFLWLFSAKTWRQILLKKVTKKIFFGVLVQKLAKKFYLKK